MNSKSQNQDIQVFPKIKNIEILGCLGSGANSVVYKAKQLVLDRIVAVKVLAAANLGSEAAFLRFQQEMKVTASLDHENIAKLLGSGLSQCGRPFMIMEFIDGHTLEEEIKNSAPLKFARIKAIFPQLLSALSYAHGLSLLHRDLKPANIMISNNSQGEPMVKILDFGLAKFLCENENTGAKNEDITQTGYLLGSPAYMSPEQCLGKTLDCRSDLYSLACVLYECLCGTLPFKANSSFEIMQEHLSGKLPSTRELAAGLELPPELARLLLLALAKDPKKRPQTADAFRTALLQALDKVTLERAPARQNLNKTKSTAWKWSLALLTVFAVIAALASQFVSKQKGQEASKDELQAIARRSESLAQIDARASALEAKGQMQEAFAMRSRQLSRLSSQKQRREFSRVAFCAVIDASNLDELRVGQDSAYYPKQVLKLVPLAAYYAKELEHEDNYGVLLAAHLAAMRRLNKKQEAVSCALKYIDEVPEPSPLKLSRLRLTAVQELLDLADSVQIESWLDQNLALASNEEIKMAEFAPLIATRLFKAQLLIEAGKRQQALSHARMAAAEIASGASMNGNARNDCFDKLNEIYGRSEASEFIKTVKLDLEKNADSYAGYDSNKARLFESIASRLEEQNKLGEAEKYYKEVCLIIKSKGQREITNKDRIWTSYFGPDASSKYLQKLFDLSRRTGNKADMDFCRQELDRLKLESNQKEGK